MQVFLQSIQQYLTVRAKDLGAATFDKDDPLAVDFVAAAANLRSLNFSIPCESLFAIKARPVLSQRPGGTAAPLLSFAVKVPMQWERRLRCSGALPCRSARLCLSRRSLRRQQCGCMSVSSHNGSCSWAAVLVIGLSAIQRA